MLDFYVKQKSLAFTVKVSASHAFFVENIFNIETFSVPTIPLNYQIIPVSNRYFRLGSIVSDWQQTEPAASPGKGRDEH